MILLVTSVALIFSITLVPAGFAKVGVKVHKWVKYDNFSPYLWVLAWEEPEYWPANNTEWMKLTVQSVADSNVEVELITHFENGTERTKSLGGNITEGSGSIGFFIIEANLAEGDEITWDHTGVTGIGCAGIKLYVNDTVTKSYGGKSREVNHVNASFLGLGPTRVSLEAYWDKATGVLCEINMSISFGPLQVGFEAATSFKMAETNMFEAAPVWTEWWVWVIIIIVIVVAGASILVWRRGKGTPARARTTSPSSS